MKLVVMDVVEQPLSVRLYVIKNGYTHNFFKITYSKFFFSNLNSSLANENVDQDFSYIEDEDDRKKCLDLFKSGDLKFDQRSKLYFQLRSKLMGGGDKQFICNDKKNIKTAGSSFAEAMGFGSVTLKMMKVS